MAQHITPPGGGDDNVGVSVDDLEPGLAVRVHVDDYEYGFDDYYKDDGEVWMIGEVVSRTLDYDGDVVIDFADQPNTPDYIDNHGDGHGYAKPEAIEVIE